MNSRDLQGEGRSPPRVTSRDLRRSSGAEYVQTALQICRPSSITPLEPLIRNLESGVSEGIGASGG